MDEDGSYLITKEQLLANTSDADGDTLSVVDLKVAEGRGTLKNNQDGNFTFRPYPDWNGEVDFAPMRSVRKQ